jgi:integrase
MLEYMEHVRAARPDMRSSSSINHIISCFRKVLRIARDQGVISQIVSTPRPERQETPRNFFRFYPLVSRERDQYQLLRMTAKRLAENPPLNAETRVTSEIYDFILWQAHTFLRPTTSEAFAVRFRDVEIAEDPKRLLITLKKGKTGFRVVTTTKDAVSIFKRLQSRPHHPDDFLFLPNLANRSSASTFMGRMFRVVLREAKLETDEYGSGAHTLYSLRHTSICMRLVLSEGTVNIYNLAKNAGTSVDQIERFYAKNLPMSAELARNLQSFGNG